MEVTSTANQASLHLPISLAFNGLEVWSLIFMLSLSIRQSFQKFCVITVLVLSKLSRLDQSPSVLIFSFFFFFCCSYSKGAVEKLASTLLCCPELQAFTWGGAVRISACKPSIPSIQSICTVNVHLCLSLPLQPLWQRQQVSLAGRLQSQQSAAERSHH